MSAPHKADQADGVTHWNTKDITLWGTAAITAGATVAVDLGDSTEGLGKSVVTADHDTAAHRSLTVGVAQTTTTAAGWVVVRVAGYRSDATVDATVAAADRLAIGATAGSLIEVETATFMTDAVAANIRAAFQTRILAVALEAAAAGVADILIEDHGFYG